MAARSKGSSSVSPEKSSKKTAKSAAKSKRKKPDTDDESENEYNSDALDESDDEVKVQKKRKRNTEPKERVRSPKKKKKADDIDDEDFDLQDGQEIVGAVVQAPQTGLVPAGQISKNTLDFLTQLKDPKCNDREWCASAEWKDFIEVFTDLLVEVDDQIPPLPPKTRFSADKTPYKTGFSASFSRSGRKGVFAFFKPGNQSIFAAGAWCPNKNELDTIRSNIQRDPSRLRRIISEPAFKEKFGEPKPGARRSIFGRDDELKVAPKGIPKTHEDIDLLKCRSLCVSHHLTDAQVLSPEFKNTLSEMAALVMPFVRCVNDMMTVPPDAEEEGEDDG
ncbi:hypothetical protein C8R47DRAFT_1095106 [Mycena vitilis]|nr:hypothetical protein C8R47DRAFT_1095106 [Mycena vitilis]